MIDPDPSLVDALLASPPRLRQLPPLGARQPGVAELREQKLLARGLSCTRHALLRDLLSSALTEPVGLQRGSLEPCAPFAALPEVLRTLAHGAAAGWGPAVLAERLRGLWHLWQDEEQTAPDTWRAVDVAGRVLDWHAERRSVAQMIQGIQGARALWASDPGEAASARARAFEDFLEGLKTVF